MITSGSSALFNRLIINLIGPRLFAQPQCPRDSPCYAILLHGVLRWVAYIELAKGRQISFYFLHSGQVNSLMRSRQTPNIINVESQDTGTRCRRT